MGGCPRTRPQGRELADGSGSGLSSVAHRLSVLLRSAAGRLVLAAVLAAVVVIVLAVVVVTRRIRRRRALPTPSGTADTDELAPLPAFRRLETALVSSGAGRAVGESVSELARRLPTDTADAEAFRAVDETCYAATPPAADRREAAASRLDAFTDAWRRRRP